MSAIPILSLTSFPQSPQLLAWSPTLAAFEFDFMSAAIGTLIGLLVGGFMGVVFLRMLLGQSLAKAKSESAEIIRRSQDDARASVQRAELDAEKRNLDKKEKLEQDWNIQRDKLRADEQRVGKLQDTIERKLEDMTRKESALDKQVETSRVRETAVAKRETELTEIITEQKNKLLTIAGMTLEDAKALLLQRVEDDSRQEMAKVVRKVIDDADSHAKEKAREITLMAIQRYAAEHTAESTVRAVPIPSDDMKGRIIGREGRNIRAIEKATGVDIIVDDTPGVIVVSCFDKVRQTVAVESLQRLIADGRMHPARIEEVVEKVRSEIEERIVKYGKEAMIEINLRGVHPKISEAMGKLHFRTSYGQNVLRHSMEVGFISQLIADQLGFDGALARRCGFLHDIGKAMDQDVEGTHPKLGMEFARMYGEKDPVLNAIGGHHADIPSTSFYTPIVMAADAISSARPGARRDSLEKYIQRLTQLQDIALGHTGVSEAYAIQAGREVRVMVDARKVSDDESMLIAASIAKKVSEEMTFPGEIKVTVLRETRAVEFAR